MAHKLIKYEYCLAISVIVVHLVRGNLSDLEWKLQEFEEYQAQIDSKRILKYGDWCNTHAEHAFAEISKSVEEITNGNSLSSFEAELGKINAAFEKLLSHGHNYCNPVKLLICDKFTNFCSCGPHRLRNQEFKYIQDLKGQCLYVKNTPCYPNDHLPGKHYNCANNTNCVFMDVTGEQISCDLPNLQKAEKTTPTDGSVQCYCRDDTFPNAYYDGPAINSVSSTLEISIFCLTLTLCFSIYS